MESRKLGQFDVPAIGFGCMCLSHAYGVPMAPADAAPMLHAALDLGYVHLDTAALYGFGANETLIGNTIADRRSEYVLASKCGIFRNEQGVREIDGRPETIRKTCEAALGRLKTDVIDLYYLHRWDRRVPIEESVGAMADLVEAGKIRSIGLSEVSADTLRRAHAVHPIAAVQTEYSLWTRNPEIKVLDACRELGVAFVAFSPLARGFLAGTVRDADCIIQGDIRRNMPRFQEPHLTRNLSLVDRLSAIAADRGCTPAQLALAWLLAKNPIVLPIPGTTSRVHLAEDFAAGDIALDASEVDALDRLINTETVAGPRYNEATQREIDTEEFTA